MDLVIPQAEFGQAEFAYNSSKNNLTQKTPFEVVYGRNPNHILDQVSIPHFGRNNMEAEEPADHIKEIHAKVKSNLRGPTTTTKELLMHIGIMWSSKKVTW
ncbi:hypothetical protein ACFX14_008397 [Malus domestica]